MHTSTHRRRRGHTNCHPRRRPTDAPASRVLVAALVCSCALVDVVCPHTAPQGAQELIAAAAALAFAIRKFGGGG